MVDKKCSKCKIYKNIKHFYKQKCGLLGRCGSCKECRLSYQRIYASSHLDQKRENDRKYDKLNREKNREKNRIWRSRNPGYFKQYYYQNTQKKLEIDKRWRLRNPDRMNCYNELRKHLKKNLISRPKKCTMCGQESNKIQSHHYDYSKPLEVIWICFSCHLHIHKKIRKII